MNRLLASPPGSAVLGVSAGRVPYAEAWAWQRDLVERRAAGDVDDVLLTLEHDKVFTAGKRADLGHVLWSEEERRDRGIDLYEVDRGGDVTYHGPGQLVGYPILKLDSLRGVVDYVRALERTCSLVASDFGVEAVPVEGLTGLWVGRDKLVAIGVRVSSHGVTSHGFAFNVAPDLDDFGGIVPCGIADRGVCSLASLGVAATVGDVVVSLRQRFAEVFDCWVRPTPSAAIRPAVAVA